MAKKQIIGMTSGCFDMFHFYHLDYLKRCAEQCDYLIVLVDSDELILKNKNKHTVIKAEHRAEILRALKCVDEVCIINSMEEFEGVIDGVDVIFKNSAQIYGKALIGGEKTVIVPDVPGYSTTDIRNCLTNGTKLC